MDSNRQAHIKMLAVAVRICFAEEPKPNVENIETQIHAADMNKKDRQCTYNVSLRPIHVTTVAVEKQ
jgi:hypothetical protein